MQVYVVANIENGGSIIGVYLNEESAKHQAKTYPMGGPYSVYYRELDVEGILEQYKSLLITLFAELENHGFDFSKQKVTG